MTDVNIVFTWLSFMPDHRQYKQNSIVLQPQETYVAVSVPVKPDYIYNADKVIAESLYANTVKPVLTPLGMRYVMDQLESVLPDVKLSATDFDPNEDEFPTGNVSTSTIEDEFKFDEDDEWK
jgi:hypothetical protein